MILKQTFLLVISIVCMSSSCEKAPLGAKEVSRFWIQNNSNNGVSFLISESFPDTIVPNKEGSLLMLELGNRRPYDQNREWEDFFAQLPADTLSVFFFDNDTLAKYDFSQVRIDYNILKRKDISLQDLNSNSYTVTYP